MSQEKQSMLKRVYRSLFVGNINKKNVINGGACTKINILEITSMSFFFLASIRHCYLESTLLHQHSIHDIYFLKFKL